MLSGSGSSETVDVTLLWSGPGVTDHRIDETSSANGEYQYFTCLILFTHRSVYVLMYYRISRNIGGH